MEDQRLRRQNKCKHGNIFCLEEEWPVSSSSALCYDRIASQKHLISGYTLYSDIQSTEKCINCTSCDISSCNNCGDNLPHQCYGLTDLAASHIIYSATPPLGIPLNLTLSKRFRAAFKLHRRTRSTKYHGNALLKYASAFGQTSLKVSPATRRIIDSTEADEKARTFLNGSVDIQLHDLHKEIKFSDSNRSPSFSSPPLENLHEDFYLGKRRCASKMSDLTFMSSSSSAYSYQSELTEYDLASKGILRCIWEDGLPLFVFSLAEGQGEEYIAKPLRINSLSDKALDFIYLFYSRKTSKKGDCFGYACQLVGKMTVSSRLSFDSSNSKFAETEFVLFDASEGKKDIGDLSTGSLRSKGLPRRIMNALRQTDTNSESSSRYICADAELNNVWMKPCFGKFSQGVGIDPPVFSNNHLLPNFELSAIIIKDCHYQQSSKKEKPAGGWGLKFLEIHDDAGINQSHVLSDCSKPGSIEDASSKTLDVLIPAGFHGGPLTKLGGPSSLIERWRSGGCCDCGGWDLGCPLTIFHSQSTANISSHAEFSHEGIKVVTLIVEGAKEGEPAALRMTVLNEELHVVSFQSKFSALQAFSIGVAIIHSETPNLRPEL